MSSRTTSFRVQFEVDGDGKVNAAFGNLAQRGEQARKAAEGVGQELLQVADRVDKAGSRTRQYARDVAVLEAAQKAGLITQKQHGELLAQVKDDLTATDWKRYQAGAAAAGAVIGTALVGVLALTIRNTIQAQRELAQLDAILQSTGAAAGYNREQLLGMAEGLSAVSTFSGGEIVEAQTRLLSYSGILGENIPRAMQAVIDQSARLGISVTQSAETIGRALESPAKAAAALAQQGFGAAFTKDVRDTIDAMVAAGREAEAQRMILDILEESYGGAAKAARDTFGGALTALRNALNDVTTGGDGSLEGARQGIEALVSVLEDPATRQAFGTMVQGVASVSAELLQGIGLLGQYMGEWNKMRALGSGALQRTDADLDSLNKRLGVVGQLIRDIEAGNSTRGQPLPGSTVTPSGRRDVLNRLQAERTGLMTEIRNRNRTELNTTVAPQFSAVTGGANRQRTGTGDLVNPEIQKEIDAVKQQAAAYGLSRTALAELNREKALASATNDTERAAINSSYDALVKRIGADESATKGAQTAKRARDEQRRAEEQLTQLFERTTASYREQIALQNDATEAARIHYSIANGALAAMSEPRQREILQLAEARDAQQRLDAVRREGLALSESLYSPLERMRALQDEYTAALARGAIDQDTWNRLISESRAELDAAEESARRNFPSMKMLMEDFAEGTQMRMGDDLFDVFSGNADRIQERWKSLLLQMAADLVASKLMEGFGSAGGAGAAGGGTGFWGSLWSSVAGAFGGGRATGGGVRGQGIYEVTEQGRPELLRQGTKTFLLPGADGVVVPATAAASGGGGMVSAPPARIEINNYGSDRVEAREQTSMGANGELMRKYVIDIGREQLAGGAWAGDIKQRFDVRDRV
ncbi:phage tail length tape measure family protein [Luteimonas terrae]|uniref:Bacteriophage tail tape measure N-terminal domain-containing protein n=1 Tax=Luteimonas terrae TaxID=1530191 RepID=A0ABU1XX62_9GAMM|nr:phage tail length tape measure family protein [Luteimonas terrae]MDR7193354.1 hypothetical protein [Luteimonas terrae]